MFRIGKPIPGPEPTKLAEPMWPPSFELHSGPVARSDHDQRPDTRPIDAPSRRKSENRLAKLGASTHGPGFPEATWLESCNREVFGST